MLELERDLFVDRTLCCSFSSCKSGGGRQGAVDVSSNVEVGG